MKDQEIKRAFDASREMEQSKEKGIAWNFVYEDFDDYQSKIKLSENAKLPFYQTLVLKGNAAKSVITGLAIAEYEISEKNNICRFTWMNGSTIDVKYTKLEDFYSKHWPELYKSFNVTNWLEGLSIKELISLKDSIARQITTYSFKNGDQELINCDLSVRAIRALSGSEIYYLSQIVNMSYFEFSQLHSIGKKTYIEINELLNHYGLSFKK